MHYAWWTFVLVSALLGACGDSSTSYLSAKPVVFPNSSDISWQNTPVPICCTTEGGIAITWVTQELAFGGELDRGEIPGAASNVAMACRAANVARVATEAEWNRLRLPVGNLTHWTDMTPSWLVIANDRRSIAINNVEYKVPLKELFGYWVDLTEKWVVVASSDSKHEQPWSLPGDFTNKAPIVWRGPFCLQLIRVKSGKPFGQPYELEDSLLKPSGTLRGGWSQDGQWFVLADSHSTKLWIFCVSEAGLVAVSQPASGQSQSIDCWKRE